MQIHGFWQNKTCEFYLPKKKSKMLGYVAMCTECKSLYVLRANYTVLIWQPVKAKQHG